MRISFENLLALTNSTKINRVVQVKSTVVAFGSSTPTNRMPPSIVKTPGPTPISASIVQKISTPKSKYNLRTRLFNNQISKVEDEVKEKNFLQIYFIIFKFLEKISNKETVTNTQIN